MPDIFLSPGDSRRRQSVRLDSRITDTARSAPVMATTFMPDADHKRQRDINHSRQQQLKPLTTRGFALVATTA